MTGQAILDVAHRLIQRNNPARLEFIAGVEVLRASTVPRKSCR